MLRNTWGNQNIARLLYIFYTIVFGLLFLNKLYEVSSLGFFITFPIAGVVFAIIFIRFMTSIDKFYTSTENKGIFINMMITFIFHTISSIWILIPASDAGPFGYDYQPNFSIFLTIIFSTILLLLTYFFIINSRRNNV